MITPFLFLSYFTGKKVFFYVTNMYFTSVCLLTFHFTQVALDLEKQPTKQLEMLQHVHYNSG